MKPKILFFLFILFLPSALGLTIEQPQSALGDITAVLTPDVYLYGGCISGPCSIYLNITEIENAIGSTDLTGYFNSEDNLTSLLDDNYYSITNPDNYITDGNTNWDNSYGFITSEVDGSTTNELQTISYDTGTDVISLTDGGSIDISEVDTVLSETTVDSYADNNNYLDLDTYPNADTDSTDDLTTSDLSGYFNSETNLTDLLDDNYYSISNPDGYIDDGNTNWDNSYGFVTNANLTYTETDPIAIPLINAVNTSTNINSLFVDDLTTDDVLSEATVDGYADNNNYLDLDTYPNADTDSTDDLTTSDLSGYFNSETNLTDLLDDNYYSISNPDGYIDDGNTNWDNSYGFVTNANLTYTETDPIAIPLINAVNTSSNINSLFVDDLTTDDVLSEATVDGYADNNNYLDLDTYPNADTDSTDDFSGNYNDLSNKPDLTVYNDTELINAVNTSSNINSLFADDLTTDDVLSETEVDNYVSNNGYLTSEVDGSTTNELQTLSYDTGTDVISLTDGGSIDITEVDTVLSEATVDSYADNNNYLDLDTYPNADTDSTDDFSGNYNDLTNKPTITTYTNNSFDLSQIPNTGDIDIGNHFFKVNGGFENDGITLNPNGSIFTFDDIFFGGDLLTIDEVNFNGSYIPQSDNVFTMGNSSNRLASLYAVNIYGNTIYEGGSPLSSIYLTSEVDGSTTNELQTLSYDTGTDVISLTDGGSIDITEVDTVLSEATVDSYADNNNYLDLDTYPNADTDSTNDFSGSYNDLSNVPINIDEDSTDDFTSITDFTGTLTSGKWCLYDGTEIDCNVEPVIDTNTQLSEATVDSYADNNNYLDLDTYPNADTDSTDDLTLSALSGYYDSPDNETDPVAIPLINSVNTSSNINSLFADDLTTDDVLSETEVDNYVSNNGYLTSEVDGSTTNELQTLSYDTGTDVISLTDGGSIDITEVDTVLSEATVDSYADNNNYLDLDTYPNTDTDSTDDFSGSYNDLTNIPVNIDTDSTDDFTSLSDFTGTLTTNKWCLYDGTEIDCNVDPVTDTNTQLSEATVDSYADNNNYLDLDTYPNADTDSTDDFTSLSDFTGTLTSGKYCTYDGTEIDCNSDTGTDTTCATSGTCSNIYTDARLNHAEDGDTYIEFFYDKIRFNAGGKTFLEFIESTFDYITLNSIFELENEPSTDQTANGFAIDDQAGETLVVGELVYLKDDGEWYKADADATATSINMLGIVLGGTCTDGNTCTIHTEGVFRDDTFAWTEEGEPLFISTTAGDFTQTAPSATGDVVRVVGYPLSDDSIYFDPDGAWVVIS